MRLPPISFHYFRTPLPYQPTWKLQERLHQIQLSQRRESNGHQDLLLLLEHRPVYTSGRRQTESDVQDERQRLTEIGADFIQASRGGQLTYHGPGQILLQLHLKEGHGVEHSPSEHTGVFLDPQTKVASIGVQVRHRLTSHGFAINITKEPQAWFDQIVACGLEDVRAGSIENATGKSISVEEEIPGLVQRFGRLYEREMVPLDVSLDSPVTSAILELEREAVAAGPWSKRPSV
ncbi:chloroplast lipoate protein ligase [Coprinopsis sp. MPI-PUGE-AT-0042]|nr:chloroplast lipoate protein ligase [Coprinopsis sp. MPI-PUGE-AT-0042]